MAQSALSTLRNLQKSTLPDFNRPLPSETMQPTYGVAENVDPSLRERMMMSIYDVLGGSVSPSARARANSYSDIASNLVDWIPTVGEGVGASDAYTDFNRGNYGQAAIGGAATMLGVVPVVGDAAAKAVRTAGKAVRAAGAAEELARRGIDMSQAARMQRAVEQGFDTNNIAYRGLSQSYDPDKSGNYQMFTSSAEDAGGYAMSNPLDSGANIVPAYIKKGNNLEIDAGGRNFNNISVYSLPKPVQLRLHPSIESVARTDDIAYAAKEAGYDSVTINNVYDNAEGLIPRARNQPQSYSLSDDQLLQELLVIEPLPPASTRLNSYTADINQEPVTTTTVFDPSNIRSINAAFDPTKRNSRDLMAGVAGGALGLSALRNINKDSEQMP